ncbi:MAG TPA: hypothetical protein VFJ85_02855 [Acidimicrobiales bacterium]|nr:hypothetical protein [Acidimicrobiales bacterium]
MATSTTIPAVSAAIVAAVAAAAPGLQVTDGRPQDSMLMRESVWVGDVTGTSTIPVMKAGRKIREERYQVEVWHWIAKPRGTLAEVRARAIALWNLSASALADDPRLGALDGVQWATEGDFELRSDFAAEGPWAALRSTVSVVARLS